MTLNQSQAVQSIYMSVVWRLPLSHSISVLGTLVLGVIDRGITAKPTFISSWLCIHIYHEALQF